MPTSPSLSLDEILNARTADAPDDNAGGDDAAFTPQSMNHGGYKDAVDPAFGDADFDDDDDADLNQGGDKIITEETHPEPGAPGAKPAPAAAQAETPPAAQGGTPAQGAGEQPPAANEPWWYRRHMKEKDAALRAAEQRAAALEAQVQARQQQHEPEPRPDPLGDPDAFTAQFDQRLARAQFETRLEFSEIRARDKHGNAVWEEVNDWLATRPDVGRAAAQQRDPCGYAVQVYNREKIAAEIGDDPVSWREREREAIRAEERARLEEEFGQSGEPRPAGQGGDRRAPRPRIPGPASVERSANPNRATPRYSGPAELGSALKHKFR